MTLDALLPKRTAFEDPTGPGILPGLLSLINARGEEITRWFDARRAETPPPLTTSVDLRHSGVKIAPVDTNLFPAGFNQLSRRSVGFCTERLRAALARQFPQTRRVLLVAERHDRNVFYYESLRVLAGIFTDAGVEVRLGSLAEERDAPYPQATASGAELMLFPLRRAGEWVEAVDGFRPDLIVLNNDLTAGFPEVLEGVRQPVVPSPGLGWWRRRKSVHFEAYAQVSGEFARAFDFDPWLIGALFRRCGRVDFKERAGMECVALNVEKLLHAVRRKYEEYGVTAEPYVFVKADSGTYGMGVMAVRSGEELFELNKKARNKMNIIKEGAQNTEVIIQEGIHTIDVVQGAPAEPMIYLIDGYPVGGAFRVNAERDATTNLNAAGMTFIGMCDESESGKVAVPQCNFSVYGLVSQLAALAAGREDTLMTGAFSI